MPNHDMLPTIAREPADVAEALETHARIDAVKAWLDQHRTRLRRWLDEKADEVESLTGGAFNVPVQGVGRVQRTDPAPRVVVSDREAFESWWYGEHPDECRTVRTDRIEGNITPALDTAREMLDSDEDYAAEAWRTVVGEIVACIVTDRGVLVPEDATDRLTPTDSGKVVDPDGQIVDGVEVRTSSRQLRVTVDRDRKDALIGELSAVLDSPETDL